MASTPNPSGDCGFRTPLPTVSRKRLRTYASVTNFKSQKRRKLSMTSMEFDKENEGPSTSALSQIDSPLDRFIPNRPKMNLPLQITPRTKRISKEFGLLDDRILNFKDENTDLSNAQSSSSILTTNDIDTLNLLRKSASSLFTEAPPVRPTSVTENLLKRRQCLVVLDSPNIQPHIDAYPISWSKQNLIAVSCGRDVYYQNLNTKVVAHLCRSQVSRSPIWVIEWAGKKRETYLASGMEDGYLQIWDATRSVAQNSSNGTTPRSSGNLVQTYQIAEEARVTACAWLEDGDILAVGARDKKVSILDVRVEHVVGIVGSHKDRVLGMKWSVDGNFLASSDYGGNVYIWDKRAGKTLVEFGGVHSSRMVHKAPVKALAWCSWKPDLLATGSYSPEGKIRIWSTSTITSHSPEPVQTIPLNTAIYSLQWSPHCKELMSTHGASFTPIFSRPPFNRTNASSGSTSTITSTQVKAVLTPLVNSITVHDYPTGKRLMSLSNAHSSVVSHSCLGPDGENVFTISPAEETIKMWQVWGKRPKPAKEKSAFDRHLIR